MQRDFALALAALGPLLAPGLASAQYKNTSFGLDAGYWLISKPSAVDPQTGTIYQDDRLPVRLASGFRLGGETNFKMDEDHVWFTGRVNAGFLQFTSGSSGSSDTNDQFDAEARRTLGTVFGIEGEIGVRYVFLTDRFRPYLQGALSYMRLMSFSSLSSDSCSYPGICSDTSSYTNEDLYLRHPNIGGIHLQPGVELIFKRDIAIHLFIDLQRWLIFNAADNTAVVFGVGGLFFT
jgi:hypothetical protein